MANSWGYFDTSALVKCYVDERGSVRVKALLRRHDFLSSAVTTVELISALCRRRRSGELSEAAFTDLTGRVREDRLRWELLEVSSSVLNLAEELIRGPGPIKTMDAIHIASLKAFQTASGIETPFITGDVRQSNAAREAGLNLIWVG
jgi:predicted nucleic acid-binding protein